MQAGVYLHTHGTDHPLGMPISPLEAMATGAWVLGATCLARGYVGRPPSTAVTRRGAGDHAP